MHYFLKENCIGKFMKKYFKNLHQCLIIQFNFSTSIALVYIFFYQIHDFTNALKEYKYIIKLTIPLLPKLRDYFTEFTYIK